MKKALFTNETQEIRNKLARTLRKWREIKKMEDEIYNLHRADVIFRFYPRVGYIDEIYSNTFSDFNDYVCLQCGMRSFIYHIHNKKDFKKSCEKLSKITNYTILEHFLSLLKPRGYDKEANFEINNSTITLKLHYEYNLRILLNVLNILINKSIETDEIYKKCWNTLKNTNTFIYRNVKITCYQNGKIKMVFGDIEILHKMKFLLDGVEDLEEAS